MKIDEYIRNFLERDSFFLDLSDPFCWRELRQLVVDEIQGFTYNVWSYNDTTSPQIPEITNDCREFLNAFFSWVIRIWTNRHLRIDINFQERHHFLFSLQNMIMNELYPEQDIENPLENLDNYEDPLGW